MRRASILLISITLILLCFGQGSSYAGHKEGKFVRTGKTVYDHQGSLEGAVLKNGDVLIYSFDAKTEFKDGEWVKTYTSRAEVYQTKTGKFKAVSEPNYFHYARSKAVLLNDGRVLIAGAFCNNSSPDVQKNEKICEDSKHIEFFDPISEKFTVGPKMLIPRNQNNLTVLKDGRVLFTGGWFSTLAHRGTYDEKITAQAEIYDPVTNSFKLSGRFTVPNDASNCDAVLLDSGSVLVLEDKGMAEIFNPATEKFRRISDMRKERYYIQSVKIKSGKILITSDELHLKGALDAEIFDPPSENFKLIDFNLPDRMNQKSLVTLKDGSVLVTGGALLASDFLGTSVEALDRALIFDPADEKLYSIGHMKYARGGHKSFLLPDGSVLLVGPWGGHTQLFLPEPIRSH